MSSAPAQMDVSTQMNHWIALTSELEDTRELIAKAIYKHYKAGRIVDDFTCELCRRLDDLFKTAREYEAHLQEDFKGYLDAQPTPGKETLAKKGKAKAMSFLTKQYIQWTVSNYRKHFRDQYVELGSRAITMVEQGQEVCSDPKVVALCKYAQKLKKATDHRWEEIQILQRENVKGNLFVSLFQNFMVQLTAFSKTQSSPFLKKFFKTDDALQQKIREQYRRALSTVSAAK